MYWTLETRPPTLDEQVAMAKQRHAQRVEEIAAEEPVPQIRTHKGHNMADTATIVGLWAKRDDFVDADSYNASLRRALHIISSMPRIIPYKANFDLECA